jgi:molybdate transport system regulatory protein
MNRISGHISAVEVFGSIALVDVQVARCTYTATILGGGDSASNWTMGMAVALLFKETEVAVAKNLSGAISLRNRFKGVITSLEFGKF